MRLEFVLRRMHRAWAEAPARGLCRDIHGDKAPGHRCVHDRKHPRTTVCHSAGSPPASQVHLRRPFSPARSPGHRQCAPCPFCSTLSKPIPPRRPWRRGLAWADLQPSTRAQCALKKELTPVTTFRSRPWAAPAATDHQQRTLARGPRPATSAHPRMRPWSSRGPLPMPAGFHCGRPSAETNSARSCRLQTPRSMTWSDAVNFPEGSS